MAVFSIIVPVYNVEKYLPTCVNSILNQSFSDFELILVDDGSPDNCGELCDQYSAADSRVQVIHKPNGGLSSARNCGMDAACGEYIVFLDSDDYWNNTNTLSLIKAEFDSSAADVVLLKHRKLNEETGILDDFVSTGTTADITHFSYAQQLAFCVSHRLYDTCAWNKAFRRHLAECYDLHFTEGIVSEDLDWAARLSIAASQLAIVSEPIHVYRKGRSGSITSSLKLKNLIDTKASIERCLAYISHKNVTCDFLDAYYSYIAYRYIIWMAESAALKDPAKKPLIREMKRYSWLLHYDGIRRVHTVRRLYRILGYRLTALLLGIYLKNRS